MAPQVDRRSNLLRPLPLPLPLPLYRPLNMSSRLSLPLSLLVFTLGCVFGLNLNVRNSNSVNVNVNVNLNTRIFKALPQFQSQFPAAPVARHVYVYPGRTGGRFLNNEATIRLSDLSLKSSRFDWLGLHLRGNSDKHVEKAAPVIATVPIPSGDHDTAKPIDGNTDENDTFASQRFDSLSNSGELPLSQTGIDNLYYPSAFVPETDTETENALQTMFGSSQFDPTNRDILKADKDNSKSEGHHSHSPHPQNLTTSTGSATDSVAITDVATGINSNDNALSNLINPFLNFNFNANVNPLLPTNPSPISASNSNANDDNNVKTDLADMKARVERIERAVSGLQSSASSWLSGSAISVGSSDTGGPTSSAVNNFVGSLTAGTIPLTPRTIEVTAMITFFAIGAVIGASLFDRLWLLGGIFSAWWSSGAVYRDTRGGLLARRVGVRVLQTVRDVQEKWNQAVIFYRTGKLAYYSSKIWEKYDTQYGIEGKINDLKRRAMRRAEEFGTAFQSSSLGSWSQWNDVWEALKLAPVKAQELDNQWRISQSVAAAGQTALAATVRGVGALSGLLSGGSDDNQVDRTRKDKNRRSRNRNDARSRVQWSLSAPMGRRDQSGAKLSRLLGNKKDDGRWFVADQRKSVLEELMQQITGDRRGHSKHRILNAMGGTDDLFWWARGSEGSRNSQGRRRSAFE